MDKNFFMENRRKLGEGMKNNSLAIFFAGRAPYKSADERYSFTPNRNFYYLTGIDEEDIILLMKKQNDEISEYLFIQEIDEVEAKWTGETISIERAEETSGITDIRFLKEFEDTIGAYINTFNINQMYFDLERQEINIAKTQSQLFANLIIDRYPHMRINNIYSDIAALRTIKREEEVELIKKAIEITYEGIKLMLKNSKAGMMEYEIEAYFNFALNREGVKEVAFSTIAASGKNATILHYDKNNTTTKENELLLVDLGAQYKYYNADISRTFPVNGKFTERQKQIYNIVLKANEEVMKSVKPGVTLAELQTKAKEVLAEGCKAIGLIEKDEELAKYYYHGVSHPLGLDTHDVGERNIKLKEGMIITDEPGLYIEEENIGIRIEDDILVTKDGYINLSKNIIKTVDEIENYMSSK